MKILAKLREVYCEKHNVPLGLKITEYEVAQMDT